MSPEGGSIQPAFATAHPLVQPDTPEAMRVRK
jgi:hypothetical protein